MSNKAFNLSNMDDEPAANTFLPLREEEELYSSKDKGAWYVSESDRLKTPYKNIKKGKSGLWFKKNLTGDYTAKTKWDHVLELNSNASILKLSKHGKNTVLYNLKKDYIPFPIFYGIVSPYDGINYFIYGPEFIDKSIKNFELGCLFKKIRDDDKHFRKYAKTRNYKDICEISFNSNEDMKKVWNTFLLNTEKSWDSLLERGQTFYKCNKDSKKCEISQDSNDYLSEEVCNNNCSEKPWWVCKNFEVGCVPANKDELNAVENEDECNKTCKQTKKSEVSYDCIRGKCYPEPNGKYKTMDKCNENCGDKDNFIVAYFKNPMTIGIILGFTLIAMLATYFINKGMFVMFLILFIIELIYVGYLLLTYITGKFKESTIGKIFL